MPTLSKDAWVSDGSGSKSEGAVRADGEGLKSPASRLLKYESIEGWNWRFLTWAVEVVVAIILAYNRMKSHMSGGLGQL